MKLTRRSLLASLAAVPATKAQQKKQPKAKNDLETQLAIDRQRLRRPVNLPSPYAEAQRRVTQSGQPAWWQSDAGVTEAVPPPWTPVKVEGSTVKVWGRAYRFADSG